MYEQLASLFTSEQLATMNAVRAWIEQQELSPAVPTTEG